jgi:hypothetical protein
MGQQQTMSAASSTLKRMIMVVALAALMALIMAASAMPAMAKNVKNSDGGPPIESGDITDANDGANVGSRGSGGACVNHDGSKSSGHCS